MKIELGKQYGFFTDTSLCIGCKACEVACKEWNMLPADNLSLTGMSYDNTGGLSAYTPLALAGAVIGGILLIADLRSRRQPKTERGDAAARERAR